MSMSRIALRSRMKTAVLAGAVALMASTAFATAEAAEAMMAQRTITVSGDAEIASKPDQARLSAGVVTQAETAASALNANSTAMNRVFAALRMAGIPENRMQTSNFSVQPQYAPYRQENPEPQRIIGYQVSNNVTVTVDDLTKVGPTLDALVRSGANQLGGIQFMVADPKPLAERARTLAVTDGAAKARTLATAAGVTLGPLDVDPGNDGRPADPGVRDGACGRRRGDTDRRRRRARRRHRDDGLRDPVRVLGAAARTAMRVLACLRRSAISRDPFPSYGWWALPLARSDISPAPSPHPGPRRSDARLPRTR